MFYTKKTSLFQQAPIVKNGQNRVNGVCSYAVHRSLRTCISPKVLHAHTSSTVTRKQRRHSGMFTDSSGEGSGDTINETVDTPDTREGLCRRRARRLVCAHLHAYQSPSPLPAEPFCCASELTIFPLVSSPMPQSLWSARTRLLSLHLLGYGVCHVHAFNSSRRVCGPERGIDNKE